ncbi:MAG: hypothetical protein JJU45_07730 [Acidimicrobiia bacterium]|nr:hypothetical protein [Acidimicrobiia bacterium]
MRPDTAGQEESQPTDASDGAATADPTGPAIRRRRLIRGTQGHGSPLRRLADGGATLVEYAVVLSLIVVVSIPATQALTDRSSQEVANQADCISTRPPPPGCQLPAIPPPPDPDDNTDPDDPGSDPVPNPDDCDEIDDVDECEVPSSVPSWAGPVTVQALPDDVNPESWLITAEMLVVDQDGAPVEGAQVTVRFRYTGSGGSTFYFKDCVTGPSGTCSVSFDTAEAGDPNPPVQVNVNAHSISSDPPADSLPGPLPPITWVPQP